MAETTTLPYEPFQPETTPFLPNRIVEELEENIAAMGAQGPQDNTGKPTPVRVEEQNEVVERRNITTSTTPTYYDLITSNPKEILLVAQGNDHYVDFNQQITSDSPYIYATGNLKIPGRNIRRIWMQTVTGTGNIRILVLKS